MRFPTIRHAHLLGLIGRSNSPAQAEKTPGTIFDCVKSNMLLERESEHYQNHCKPVDAEHVSRLNEYSVFLPAQFSYREVVICTRRLDFFLKALY